MAIHASANPANIRRSIEKFLVDAFVGATAFPAKFAAAQVWWPGVRIDTETLDYWLRVTLAEAGRDFYSAGRDSVASYLTAPMVMLEVWVKREAYRTNPHILEQAIATLRAGLVRGTVVTMKDYDSGTGTNTMGAAAIETVSGIRRGEEGPWMRATIDITLQWVERDT